MFGGVLARADLVHLRNTSAVRGHGRRRVFTARELAPFLALGADERAPAPTDDDEAKGLRSYGAAVGGANDGADAGGGSGAEDSARPAARARARARESRAAHAAIDPLDQVVYEAAREIFVANLRRYGHCPVRLEPGMPSDVCDRAPVPPEVRRRGSHGATQRRRRR